MGLLCLGLGGVMGATAYSGLNLQTRSRVRDLELLNTPLEEQH